jgi:autophagy-related protein 101
LTTATDVRTHTNMNYVEHVLNVVLVPHYQVKEVARCLIHTILFNRALGPLKPREQYCELFDICFAKIDSIDIDRQVEDAVEKLSQSLRIVGDGTAKGRIAVSFFEKKKRTVFFGITTREDQVTWEQWIISIVVNRQKLSGGADFAADRSRQARQTESIVTQRIFQILNLVNEKKEHLPVVNLNSDKVMVFDFKITIPKIEEKAENWFTRMLQQGPPSLGS